MDWLKTMTAVEEGTEETENQDKYLTKQNINIKF